MKRIASHAVLVAGALIMLYPLVWMVAGSFKTTDEIVASAGLLPRKPVTVNYTAGWSALVSMMLPIHVLIIPQYTLFHSLGWIDTFLPLTVPKFLAVDGFFIFLMVQFIRGLPTELDDAARIDGCGPVQIFLRIIAPLMAPALVTTAIFTFIWTWDDFFSQLVYLSDVDHYTVPMALRAFLDSSGESSWGAMFAMATLSLVPVLVFFLVFQRRITEGISTTGLKG